jgi:polyphosphate glucokinase
MGSRDFAAIMCAPGSSQCIRQPLAPHGAVFGAPFLVSSCEARQVDIGRKRRSLPIPIGLTGKDQGHTAFPYPTRRITTVKRNKTARKPSRILVLDIGGTNVKVAGTGRSEAIKIPSGLKLTPAKMVREVKKAVRGWEYQAVSIGYPGMVAHGCPAHDPRNLGAGWVGFDFHKAFGRPVKLINDAAMQALGSYDGGRMLFLGLGTGLGSAMVVDGILEPLELAHLPYRHGKTFEDYVGLRGLERLGKKRWRRHVDRVVKHFIWALEADHVVLGGGNAKKLKTLPPKCRLGDNSLAIKGGLRLWQKF